MTTANRSGALYRRSIGNAERFYGHEQRPKVVKMIWLFLISISMAAGSSIGIFRILRFDAIEPSNLIAR
jgi:hypothetical protein